MCDPGQSLKWPLGLTLDLRLADELKKSWQIVHHEAATFPALRLCGAKKTQTQGVVFFSWGKKEEASLEQRCDKKDHFKNWYERTTCRFLSSEILVWLITWYEPKLHHENWNWTLLQGWSTPIWSNPWPSGDNLEAHGQNQGWPRVLQWVLCMQNRSWKGHKSGFR